MSSFTKHHIHKHTNTQSKERQNQHICLDCAKVRKASDANYGVEVCVCVLMINETHSLALFALLGCYLNHTHAHTHAHTHSWVLYFFFGRRENRTVQ